MEIIVFITACLLFIAGLALEKYVIPCKKKRHLIMYLAMDLTALALAIYYIVLTSS